MPSTLEKFGLMPALKEICERFQSASLIPVFFQEHGEMKSLDQKKELKVYRVVQELINNAVKHSQASQINVNVFCDEQLRISVEDDGLGFDPELKNNVVQSGKGLGLYNMTNRTRLLNAKLEFDKHIKKGSKITLTVPYETTESLHR
jgi:signal transduction histidine kinase